MSLHCVEARRDQHDVWGELVGDGHDHRPEDEVEQASHLRVKSHFDYQVLVFTEVPEGSQVLCISHGRLQASSEGNVDVKANTRSAAHLHAGTHKTKFE